MIGTKRFFANLNGAPRKVLALGVTSASVFQPAEIAVDRGDLGMVRTARIFHDAQGAPIQFFGLVKFAGSDLSSCWKSRATLGLTGFMQTLAIRVCYGASGCLP